MNRVIGLHFFEGQTVNKDSYLNRLQTFAYFLTSLTMFFSAGWSNAQLWARVVRQSLNHTFPDRWIGRDGPTSWPPQSPDITPLDFFFWGYVKEQVFQESIQDIAYLKMRITTVIFRLNTSTHTTLYNFFLYIGYFYNGKFE